MSWTILDRVVRISTILFPVVGHLCDMKSEVVNDEGAELWT